MANSPTYEDLESRIKILESKIIELYSPASENFENIWSVVFEKFEEIVFQLDKNNIIENANQSALNYFNKNKAELFGHHIREFFENQTEPDIIQIIESQSKEYRQEKVSLTTTGKNYLISIYSVEHPQKKLIIFHPEIVVEEKQIKTENEDRYLKFLEQLPEGIIETDLTGKTLFINHSACKKIGISKEEAVGRHINEIFKLNCNIFFNSTESLIKFIIAEGNASYFVNNTSIETIQGPADILFSITAQKEREGSLRGFIISFIDYSEKHKKEKENKEREERLFQMLEKTKTSLFQESKNIFSQKLEANYFKEGDSHQLMLQEIISKDALQRLQDEFSYTYKIASLIVDENGAPLTKMSNFSSACKILSRGKVIDDKCFFVDLALTSHFSKSVFEVQKCESCNITVKKIPILANGKEIANWVCGFVNIEGFEKLSQSNFFQRLNFSRSEIKNLIENEPLPNKQYIEKATNDLWSLCQQISSLCYDCLKQSDEYFSRKKLLAELSEAKIMAELADKQKTAFIASMSHEIRTPMNAIIGFADLLNDPDFTEKEKEEFIKLINNNGEILLHLIDDIIDIAKIETGELRIENTECHVNSIINETALEARDNLKKQGKENVEVIISVPKISENFAILTDPYRFKQILTNLVSNAQKFTTTGSIEIGYKIKSNQLLTGEELFIEFYVKDTGIGIPEDKQTVIFDRFKQADEKIWKKFGGSGLGLTISQRLVKLLGGDIWVSSTYGKGSTFYFTLPYFPVDAKNILQTIEYQKIGNLNLEGKTILVVEDIDSNFNLVRTVLSKTNAQIIWAKDGKQAVDACRSRNIDLVLMDIKLPELNGLIATQRIKEMYKKLPIIAITAYARDDDRMMALEAGCSDYIAKPIKREQLLYLISRYLNL